MSTAIVVPDATQFQKKAVEVLAQANAIHIQDDNNFVAAGEFLKGLKWYQKELDATFDTSIDAAHKAHKAIVAAKKTHSEPIAQAETVVKVKLAIYHEEQE